MSSALPRSEVARVPAREAVEVPAHDLRHGLQAEALDLVP